MPIADFFYHNEIVKESEAAIKTDNSQGKIQNYAPFISFGKSTKNLGYVSPKGESHPSEA